MPQREFATEPPAGWISKARLLGESGATERSLTDWSKEFKLAPRLVSLGRGGTIAYYPPNSLPMIKRLLELRLRRRRNLKDWRWYLWLDGYIGHSEICELVEHTLGRYAKALALAVEKPEIIREITRKNPGIRDRVGGLYGRVRKVDHRAAFLRFVIELGAGRKPSASLYDAVPPLWSTFLQLVDLPSDTPFPDPKNFPIVLFSPTKFSELLAKTDQRQMDQVRSVILTLSQFVETLESFDWETIPTPLTPLIGALGRRPDEAPSKVTRNARRKRQPKRPGVVDLALVVFREPELRILLIPLFVYLVHEPPWSYISPAIVEFVESVIALISTSPSAISREQ